MGFKKTNEEIGRERSESWEFYDAEMLTVFWETKPEIVETLLPFPLRPARKPVVTAFFSRYPRTNFGPGYLESALFLRSEFNGEDGNYCLAMHVTNDMAMALGREVYGFPKKLSDIEFEREGKIAKGRLERYGRPILELQSNLSGKPNTTDFLDLLAEYARPNGGGLVTFLFKHFPAPDRHGFDYHPRLIRVETIMRPTAVEFGEADIMLSPSDTDPWFQVEIVNVLGALYTAGHHVMKKGDVVAEVDSSIFAPYACIKWDR